MRFFDLHCDTLYKAVTTGSTLDDVNNEVTVSSGKKFSAWTQCMAIWIPDGISDNKAVELFEKAYRKLKTDAETFGVSINQGGELTNLHSFFFTVENALVIGSDIDRVKTLSECGVRMITLTWNDVNLLGGGADTNMGLTDFGKVCIREFENNSIVVDVSHASEKMFFDVAQCSRRPFVASHSNSKSICNHRRNLSDEQFCVIVDRGGIVGINFHRDFLSESSKSASLKDVLNHTEHFLSLGGEDHLCIGSDFDGSDIPRKVNSLDKIYNLYEAFLKIGYNEQLVQKIMYDNAHNFFSRF
ncbi:MAG: membrane dipeptidase [Ruminococcus sp.]|nr:membrane dipeptidase [Ruminococcus sp.]